MPPALVLLPSALLAAAAACRGLQVWGPRRVRAAARPAAVTAGWLALVAPLLLWAAARRAPVELLLPLSLAGVPVGLRLDAVALGFQLLVLLPHALLATAGPSVRQAVLGALATSMAVLTAEADRLLLTAVGLATCVTLAVATVHSGEGSESVGRGRVEPPLALWLWPGVAALLVAWAALALEVTAGTSTYGAVPVTAMRVPVFLLLAAGCLAASGTLPWRTWASRMVEAPFPGGAMAAAVLIPLGFLPLVHSYGLGGGHWPSASLGLTLAGLGVMAALVAAARAQAAATRSAYVAELLILNGGLALLGLALGKPLGVAAGLAALGGSALVVGLGPILSRDRGPAASLGLALLAGAPPALVFGGRVGVLEAAFDAGGGFAYLALAGVGAWLVSAAAALRALELPCFPKGGARLGRGAVAAGLAVALVGGLGLGLFQSGVALEAAGELMPLPPSLQSAQLQPTSATGGWDPYLSGLPLALLGAAGLMLARRGGRALPASVRQLPAPLLELPLGGWCARVGSALAGLRAPQHYRSLLAPGVLTAAFAGSRPWLWGGITLALALLVAR